MLYVIRLVHLWDYLPRRGEFSVGDSNFGFAVAGSRGRRKSQGGHHHFPFDDPARCNPCFCNLEGLKKVTDVVGQLPRRIDTLPSQDILLETRNHQGILYSE